MNVNKNNPGINVITMIIILIGLIVGAFVAGDLYTTVHTVEKQSLTTGEAVNKTVSQLQVGQEKANERGNQTIANFAKLFGQIINSEHNIQGNLTRHREVANYTRDQLVNLLNLESENANNTFYNQEHFFKPYLNKSFTEIMNRLDALENTSR